MNDENRSVDDHDLDALLRRVGLRPAEANDAADELPRFDPFVDPATTDRLGRELGARLRAVRPDLVCVWEEPEDMILGHVVSLALGIRWVRCVNADGLVALQGSVPDRARCVIVTDAVRAAEPIVAIRNLVRLHGGEVVAIGALLGTPELAAVADGAVATISLHRNPDLGW